MSKDAKKDYDLIPFPHNALFHQMMEEVNIARDFFKHNLPKDILDHTDLTALERQPDTFVSKKGDNHLSDVIYKTKIRGQNAYLACIIEHQSSPDAWMALRLQEYALQFLRAQIKKGIKKLPALFLTLFYHGRRKPYPFSCDFFDLFERPDFARACLSRPFHLVDVTQISDDALLAQGKASMLGMLQKHIFDRDILNALENLVESGVFRQFSEQFRDMIRFVIKYILQAGESADQEKVFEKLAEAIPENRDDIMTIAQQLRNEGLQEGLKQGMLTGIEKGMEKGMEKGIYVGKQAGKEEALHKVARNLLKTEDPAFVAKMTGLTLEEVSEISEEG